MPVGSTSHRSVQVLGFDEYGHLTPVRRLVSSSCSSGQRFAIGLPSDSQSPAKPLPLANSSPCRASRGLSPPSRCALPGAPQKNAAQPSKYCAALFIVNRPERGRSIPQLKKLLRRLVQLSPLGRCLLPPFFRDSSSSRSSLRWCSVSLTGVSTVMWQYRSPG